MFKLWSELNSDAFKILNPDFGIRSWNSLTESEKYLIWKHLENYFFLKDPQESWDGYGSTSLYYEFHEPLIGNKENRILVSIHAMKNRYKSRNYTKNYLESAAQNDACTDFYSIFINEDANVVLELLSFYCKVLIRERAGRYPVTKAEDENQNEYEGKVTEWELNDFNEFANDLNEVFLSFGLDIYLTKNGFIPKQEQKIIDEIFKPVIESLSHSKWASVNSLLTDAFAEYRKNTPNGYSTCVTHSVAAIEAFLQIAVKGQPGEGDFATLISEGQRKKLIPEDIFTKEIFRTIVSILMKERKETGDAHVKKSYATEKNAKMVLNLTMVFLQHCITT
jgi:hypothetical protein